MHSFQISLIRAFVQPISQKNSHMSPTNGELLSVTVDPENSQKILCFDSCEQSSLPTIATYENQALAETLVIV